MSQFTPPAFDINELMKKYEDQQAAANAANETRYQGILGLLQRQGASSKLDVARSGAAERSDITQSMISRGLYSSTVMDALKNQSLERQDRENTRIDESVADRTAGVMERRTDQGPNLGLYSTLLSQAAAGYGQQAGQQAGQSSVERGYGFAGVNPSRFSSSGGGGGGGGGGGFNISSGGGGGGSTIGGVETFRNNAPPVGSMDRYLWNVNQQRLREEAAARASGSLPPSNLVGSRQGNRITISNR